ncbi:MAG TPA: trypsin-like serine protease [Trebonia sp.]|jgi:V8-like Glu-specific endopeptidase|nr:trypsin-like serine protease [Trebonia sp.]
MRRLGRLARKAGTIRAVPLALASVVLLTAAAVTPARGVASGIASWMAGGIGRAVTSSGTAGRDGQPFGGVAAVGALLPASGQGGLGQHFCTASVVNSPAGDIAVTAAHCVTDNGAADSPGTLVFAPGYTDGTAPYGTWQVTRVYTDAAWRSSQDPDDDVAFLTLAPAANGEPIEDVTGAETLGTGWPAHTYVRVIGYPDGAAQPVSCENWADSFSPAQLVFDCGGYTDGTSGGPFLADASASSGEGTVIGVIGGYEQGGDTPSVSYSIVFGPTVASLLRTAEAGG